ncbi:hypothetical protein [Engelhardtia mirabilis]|uniref:Uncharacterized protein n=1 Tax=Engelhardtia mirabilis TaxID=2528011 RepID=A0A518BNK2_9BACT|nr:hypothetical protein Pla133_36580 [Planctomycetes bacterium Pla133]QDV02884.1 hypothetical protein Pla86_36560 [Planctomycetes bacterium Pla86]
MNILKQVWGALVPKFLGGEVLTTVGSVRGQAGVGVTADPQKATGEVRVHLVKQIDGQPLVTLELAQAELPGDGRELLCVRLSPSEAEHLASMLGSAVVSARRNSGER